MNGTKTMQDRTIELIAWSVDQLPANIVYDHCKMWLCQKSWRLNGRQ